MKKQLIKIFTATTILACGSAFSAQNPYTNTGSNSFARNQIQGSSLGHHDKPPAPAGKGNQAIEKLLQQLLDNSRSIHKAVQNSNKLQIKQWNLHQRDLQAAHAQLLPSNLNFLWQLTGYQHLADIDVGKGSKGPSSDLTMLCPDQSDRCLTQAQQLVGILIAQKDQKNSQAQGEQQPESVQDKIAAFASALVPKDSQADSFVQNKLISYALAQVAGNNSASDKQPSADYSLQQAIGQPLGKDKDSKTDKSWFQTLSQASTPQLLRSVAIMSAINNYIAYQNLRINQTRQLLQVAELGQTQQLVQQLKTLNDNSRDQTNQISDKLNLIKNSLNELNRHMRNQ